MGRGAPELDEGTLLNRSLDDVVRLLEREIERLKASLEVFRLSAHPQRQDIIRWHVRALDDRQDALDDMKRLLEAAPDGAPRH
jgi:hypothetical protein